MNCEQIFNDATAAAKAAVAKRSAVWGGHDAGACGFGWVELTPARGPFVAYCKANKLGSKIGYKPGFQFWNPGCYNGQNIDIKEAGADAFAAVLNLHGLNARSCSRLD